MSRSQKETFIETKRTPKTIRKNCSHLTILRDIGLVCPVPDEEGHGKAFTDEHMESNPCRGCKTFKASITAIGSVYKYDVSNPYYKPKEDKTLDNAIDELEKSEKTSMYDEMVEYKTEEEIENYKRAVKNQIRKDLSTIQKEIIDKKNAFFIRGLRHMHCCGMVLSIQHPDLFANFIYRDKDGFIYKANNDEPLHCRFCEEHIHFDHFGDIVKSSIKSPYDPNNYYEVSHIIDLEEKRMKRLMASRMDKAGVISFEQRQVMEEELAERYSKSHTRHPSICAEPKEIEENLYKCPVAKMNLRNKARICQTCMGFTPK